MAKRFHNKTALITGAGHGIGRRIALDFAAEGARVGVNDVSSERAKAVAAEIAAAGGRSLALGADVRSAHQVDQMLATLAARIDVPDILVNNAGVYPNSLIIDMSEEEWDRVWDINMKGMFLVSRAALRMMIAEKSGGKIINMSSGAAMRARVGASHYCSSKAAISMFSQVLALEAAEHNIQVNAVAPGLIEVPDWDLAPEYIDALVGMTPRGRIGQPADISAMVRYLASDDADFITGAVMLVDGGAAAGQRLPLSG
ncbi:MAG: SDR family NAD(P)-dependent oxidoreductase [Chloroflexi bacterium]|nr:SDR family NAD(P)-dependent oxidoreductase [Chloroflexota bacterium]